MSFSKDVKNYLKESNEARKGCCKKSFQLGEAGKPLQAKCKKCACQYVSGVFYSYGTMSEPENKPQLFIYPPEEIFDTVFQILESGTSPNKGKSKGKLSIYYKSCDKIGDFLAFCKATSFALRMYDEGIEKKEKSRVQRECNGEVANMKRAADAAARQLDAIRTLKKYKALDGLKKELVYAARLREEHPEEDLSTLVSLSEMPVSKSGLNYRLKKLIELADSIKNQE